MLNKTVFRLVLLLGAQIISFMNKHPFTESVQGIYRSLRIPRLTRTTDTRLAFFKTGCKECLEVLVLIPSSHTKLHHSRLTFLQGGSEIFFEELSERVPKIYKIANWNIFISAFLEKKIREKS